MGDVGISPSYLIPQTEERTDYEQAKPRNRPEGRPLQIQKGARLGKQPLQRRGIFGGAARPPKSAWMEDPMSEQGHEENRQEDRQQDLLGNSLYTFGVHRAMAQEAAECVKRIVGAGAGEELKKPQEPT